MDVIDSTLTAKLLRQDSNQMLAQLESMRLAEELFDEKGIYIGPRILYDEEGFAAQAAMMEHPASDGEISSDNPLIQLKRVIRADKRKRPKARS